jgi:hypothetical protein
VRLLSLSQKCPCAPKTQGVVSDACSGASGGQNLDNLGDLMDHGWLEVLAAGLERLHEN